MSIWQKPGLTISKKKEVIKTNIINKAFEIHVIR